MIGFLLFERNRTKSEGASFADPADARMGADPATPGAADAGGQPQRGGARQQPPRILGGGRPMDETLRGSLGSVPDPSDPTTVSKTFRSKKASAQALLASRDKMPKAQGRKRRGKVHGRRAGV